ncbi:MAG: hypothetical protein EU542_05730 [Promethearchaeota archaeon]|nr:MAG: hypothetical protein EU542_05730 [Candidatus Lokiarchaeota archaeon]
MDKKNSEVKVINEKMSHAIWRKTNDQKYLEVYSPSHYVLGVLQGQFAATCIHKLKIVIEAFASTFLTESKPYQQLVKIAKHYEHFIPPQYKEEMRGMSDGINEISYEDILLQNCFIDLIYGRFLPEDIYNPIFNSYNLACTSFGIKASGLNILGQNFDFSRIFRSCMYFSLLKMPNKPDIFSLRLGSLLSLPAGYTNNISMTVNIVKTTEKGKLSIPTSVKSRIVFEEGKNAESTYKIINESHNTASYNLLIADGSKIIGLENLPTDHLREDVSNFIVKSNTFTQNKFQKYLIDKEYSKKRQARAESLLKHLYGSRKFSNDNLLEIMADGPTICRNNPLEAITMAFMTRESFGLGSPKKSSYGINPFSSIDF